MGHVTEERDLLDVVLEAIHAGGWSHTMAHSSDLPYRLTMTNGPASHQLAIYVWRLGNAVKRGGRRVYALSIKTNPPLLTGNRFKTLLLGWHDSNRVFVAFDAYKNRNFSGRSLAVLLPKQKLEAARTGAVSFHSEPLKGSGREVVVAFEKNRLTQYVNSVYPEYHSPSREGVSDEEAAILEDCRLDQPLADALLDKLPLRRRLAFLSMNRDLRQGTFQAQMLQIYQRRCAVCGLQAELTDAVHIIDTDDERFDDVRNGIQLCRNHHKAFDDGLFGIDPDYTIIIGTDRRDKLREMKLDSGLHDFIVGLRVGDKIWLPAERRQQPKPEYLEERCDLKGIRRLQS